MHEEHDNSLDIDQVFSERLLELSKINSLKISTKAFSIIQKSHGPFVMDEHLNTFFDLRSFDEKPFWGHNHPLQLKAEILGQTFNDFKANNALSFLDLFMFNPRELIIDSNFTGYLHLYKSCFIEVKDGSPIFLNSLESDLFNFIKIVLFRGERILSLSNLLESNFSNDSISVSGLTLSIKDIGLKDLEDIKKFGLLINNSNFEDNTLKLYIPTSFTQKQLESLLLQLSSFFKDIKCL